MQLVHRDVHQTTAKLAVYCNTISTTHASDIFRVQVAGNVNIAAFKHKTLCSAFLNVTNNNTFHCRRAQIEIWVGD